MTRPADWEQKLLAPFLERVRSRLQVAPTLDAATRTRMAYILAARAAEVRWGQEGLEEFIVRNDADILAALGYFPRLPILLKRAE
jgi:hypothetical protein